MKSNFELKGWLAVGVTLAAAVALILSVTLLNRREVITVEPFGVTHFGAVHVDDGSVSEPSLGFTGDTDVGFYRVCANDIGVSAGGSKVGDFTSAGWTGGVSVGSNDLTGRNITATGTLSVGGASSIAGAATFNGATDFNAAMNVDANGDFDSLSTAGNIDMTTMNNTGAGAVTINDELNVNTTISSTGNITVGGSLVLDGVAFTGPLVGFTGSVSNNVLLAHGVGTTPTEVICGIVNTGALTETVYISATNATSVTLGVFDITGAAWTDNLTVHCIATR